MAKTVILADFNWIMIRSAFRFNEFKITENDTDIYTGSVYGCLEFAKTIIENYENVEIYFCLDGKPKRRLEILPTYKGKRHENEPKPEIAAAKSLAEEPVKILSAIPNIHFIKDPEREADDLMAMISFRELGKGRKPIIFSGDKDMLQLQQFGINIAKNIEEGKLLVLSENYTTAHKDLGVPPEELLYLRVLEGDRSDCIPGAAFKGCRDEIKRAFASAWFNSKDRHLENFDKIVEDCIPTINEVFSGDKARKNNIEKLKTIKNDCLRNLELMELDIYHPIYEAYKNYKETRDKSVLNEVKQDFQLNNIKLVEYDIDEDDIINSLDRLDLGRFKAWLSYNNYI